MNRNTIITILSLLLAQSPSFAGDLTGIVTAKGARDSRNIVVYLKSVPGKFTPPSKHPQMDQKNLQFIPPVLPILTGTTVDFLNSDDVMHNVFTPAKECDKFNLGSWPKGEIRSQIFESKSDEPLTPVILCNVHPEMEAYVVVLQNPFYAVTDKEGKFAISGIPAGEYEIGLWHAKLKGEAAKAVIPASGSATVDLKMHR